MSVHYRRRVMHQKNHSPAQPISSIHTQIRSPLTRPHASGLDFHVTPFEVLFLLLALGILIALLSWLSWLCFEATLDYIKSPSKSYILSSPAIEYNTSHGGERMPELLNQVGMGIGRTVEGLSKSFADAGKLRRRSEPPSRHWKFGGNSNQQASFMGRDNHGPLYGGLGGGAGRREILLGDCSTGDSDRTLVSHREDCEGVCGVQSATQW